MKSKGLAEAENLVETWLLMLSILPECLTSQATYLNDFTGLAAFCSPARGRGKVEVAAWAVPKHCLWPSLSPCHSVYLSSVLPRNHPHVLHQLSCHNPSNTSTTTNSRAPFYVVTIILQSKDHIHFLAPKCCICSTYKKDLLQQQLRN